MPYETVLYEVRGGRDDHVNRPERLNTIVPPMPDELEAAVQRAIADGGQGNRAARRRTRVLRRVRFSAAFINGRTSITTDGEWDPERTSSRRRSLPGAVPSS